MWIAMTAALCVDIVILGLTRFNGRVSDRNYAAACNCNCASNTSGLT
jgi:hypothetical protein